MLIPGIKIGQKDWPGKVAANPKVAEIWYRVDQAEIYTPILTALKEKNIPFGLHFWAVTSQGYEPNLAYPGPNQQESLALMKRCLDHAKDWQAVYVNIHSGNRTLMKIDFDHELMESDPTIPIIPDADSVATRAQALRELGEYAHHVGVPLFVESVTAKVAGGSWHSANARLKPIDAFSTSLSGLSDLFSNELIGFTNDFCHTFAMEFDQPRNQLVAHFQKITDEFLPYTKLCHINTLSLPYNGTDEHHGILPEDMNFPGVFPNPTELLDLLHQLNQQSHDIYLVNEPMEKHVENYHELSRLISTL